MPSSPLLTLQAAASALVAMLRLVVWGATGGGASWPLWIAVALVLHDAPRRALGIAGALAAHAVC